MARETLPVALDLMFGHEGGYVNVKSDRGGPTKYGITHTTLAAHRGVSSVTADQVKRMTLQEAEAIYRRSYWSQSGGDILPAGLDYAAFDFGVNSYPTTAVKKLQKVLGVREDGHVGEQTAAAVATYPGGLEKLIRDYCEERMRYLRSLTNAKTGFPANGRGWTIRVTGKDPKREWKDQPGVVGNAIRLAAAAHDNRPGNSLPLPINAPPEAEAKADVRDTGVIEIIKKPEALLPGVGTLLTGVSSITGDGPVAWMIAICGIAIVFAGIWYFIRRVREAG
ncbi:glycoside hydrolase family 108 protein [Neorhizobium petrolearium]|uniref:Glycoside hydrolase family 108 protein n=1 Tax=Neorhizobium petrolearium TaxID=515361 RepID=A0ABY8M2B0_9HYPH|nr:glycoside hydrolase family 108 protein [Neorhizobium petrolearium]MCC2608405.1 glycoside hydrolase family 108 protein [Neorhizobium petrolearium]WGI68683.1 glycoside hydrolase family 108 protein [Neorhizobium petrolearium]